MEHQLAIEAVKRAGQILLNHKIKKIIMKGKSDYTTNVDFVIQNYLQNELKTIYPDFLFLAEEMEAYHIELDKTTWILDPVDGTTNLMHRYNHSAISLALVSKGEIIFGVVYNPFCNELFWACKGGGAYLNSYRINVSSKRKMNASLMAVGTAPHNKVRAKQNFRVFYNLFLCSQDIRRSGSASLDLAYVACGRVDAFLERDLKIWDVAAGILLVKEAGGVVSNWKGKEFKICLKENILATNTCLQKPILKTIKGTKY